MNDQQQTRYRESILAMTFLCIGSYLGMNLPTLGCIGVTVALAVWLLWNAESIRFKAEQKNADEAKPSN